MSMGGGGGWDGPGVKTKDHSLRFGKNTITNKPRETKRNDGGQAFPAVFLEGPGWKPRAE